MSRTARFARMIARTTPRVFDTREPDMTRSDVAHMQQDECMMPFMCLLFRIRHGINTIR